MVAMPIGPWTMSVLGNRDREEGVYSAIGLSLLSIKATSGDGHNLVSLIGETFRQRRAGFRVRWAVGARREAEAGEL